ncbi:thiosulfate oxidation carrier complex protein SoxZ [Pseudoroseomonas wenyumeiae]
MPTLPITARITLPPSAQRGEVVTVRVLVRHPMERAVDAPGLTPLPRKILHTLRVTYAGEEVFRMALSPASPRTPIWSSRRSPRRRATSSSHGRRTAGRSTSARRAWW